MSLSNRFLDWLDSRGSYRAYFRDGQLLFRRYYLFEWHGYGLNLHHYQSDDPDDVHCHPWWNVSLVLKGGYYEQWHDGTKDWRGPGTLIFRQARVLHRLSLWGKSGCAESWSLFFHGPPQREWGFVLPSGGWEAHAHTTAEVPNTVGVFFPRAVYEETD